MKKILLGSTLAIILIPLLAFSKAGNTSILYNAHPTIIKYKVDFSSGQHGHLVGNTLLYVVENHSLKNEKIPKPKPDNDYVFDKWVNKSIVPPLVVTSWSNEIIVKPTSYQAEFKKIKKNKEVNIYRLYNPNTGEHFYTQSVYERNSLIKVGWSNEGLGWKAPETGKPIYRLYNPNALGGDHYYTMSSYEVNSLVKVGWRKDNNGKPIFYSGGNVKVYVAYNPNAKSGAHNYTTSYFEQDSLLKRGWKYGKVAWYGM